MMWVHAKDINYPQQWPIYIKRRINRIYPSYWAAFLLLFSLYLFQGRIGEFKEISLLSAVKSFFLFPQQERLVVVVSWTLVYEMIFYSFFGLLILNGRMGVAVIAAWIAAIFAFNFIIPLPPSLETVRQFFGLRNLEFFVGVGAAMCLQYYQGFSSTILWKSAILITAAGIVINYFLPIPFWLAVIPAALFLIGSAHDEQLQANIPNPLLYLGKISYSLYLIHTPIILLAYKISIALNLHAPVLTFLITLSLSIFGGALFYNLIEKNISIKKKRVAANSLSI